MTRLEVTAETLVASLKLATVSVTNAKRSGSWAEVPGVADGKQEAPF